MVCLKGLSIGEGAGILYMMVVAALPIATKAHKLARASYHILKEKLPFYASAVSPEASEGQQISRKGGWMLVSESEWRPAATA